MQGLSANDYFPVSYDVCSLFTSIPLSETIEIAVELIFQNKPNLKISKNELQQLFKFATSGTHFLFKGNFYDQIDGISMGSPLGPVLANFLNISILSTPVLNLLWKKKPISFYHF